LMAYKYAMPNQVGHDDEEVVCSLYLIKFKDCFVRAL